MFCVITAGIFPSRCRLASARWPQPGRAAENCSSMAKRRRQDSFRMAGTRHELVERNGLIFGPQPARRTKIRNATFGGNASPGERQDHVRCIHEVAQPRNSGLNIGRNHVFTPYRSIPGLSLEPCPRPCPGKASRYGTKTERSVMRYLHTMLRVRDLDAALQFFCTQLGLVEIRRRPDEKGRYTNVFLAAPQDRALVETSLATGRDAPLLELTYNWDAEDYGEARYF